MLIIHRSDLPEPFIRRFRPVLADERERGLPRYLFDRYGLDFFRRMTTGEPVVPQAVWSVMPPAAQKAPLELRAGELPGAVSYVITEIACDGDSPAVWTLPRRLTLRQRIRRRVLHELLEELRGAAFAVPMDVIRLIEARLEDGP